MASPHKWFHVILYGISIKSILLIEYIKNASHLHRSSIFCIFSGWPLAINATAPLIFRENLLHTCATARPCLAWYASLWIVIHKFRFYFNRHTPPVSNNFVNYFIYALIVERLDYQSTSLPPNHSQSQHASMMRPRAKRNHKRTHKNVETISQNVSKWQLNRCNKYKIRCS